MPVVPQPVRTANLPVDESALGLELLDHRHPAQRDTVEAEPIADVSARPDRVGLLEDLKAQPRWRDELEVPGAGEELEHLGKRPRDVLLALQVVDPIHLYR